MNQIENVVVIYAENRSFDIFMVSSQVRTSHRQNIPAA
jgi:phospholipase C